MRGRVNAIRTFKGLVADLRVYKFPSEGIYLSNDSYIPVVREVYTFWERMGIGV